MFTVTIEKSGLTGCGAYNTPSTTVSVTEFTEKKQARAELRRLQKEDGYKKHYHFIYNTALGTEVFTNF